MVASKDSRCSCTKTIVWFGRLGRLFASPSDPGSAIVLNSPHVFTSATLSRQAIYSDLKCQRGGSALLLP